MTMEALRARPQHHDMSRTLIALVASISAVAALTACEPDGPSGSCNVTTYPVPGTSYNETNGYCATAAQCAAYCDAVRGRSDTGDCNFDAAANYCFDGDLPRARAGEVFCAVYRSISCGGGSDSYEPHCNGSSCDLSLGSSDYDPGLGCTTRIGSEQATGSTCDAALSALAGGGSCPAEASDTACTTCNKSSCCDELTACQDSSECVALFSCVVDCPESGFAACRDACGSSHSGGIAPYNAYVGCSNDSCSASCS